MAAQSTKLAPRPPSVGQVRISPYFDIARSTLYRWLHQIEDQEPSGTPVNKTPIELVSPGNIEQHVFTETRVTAYRLKTAA